MFTELGYHEQINILRNMELEKEKNENRRKSRRKSSYKNRYKKSFNSKMLEVIFNASGNLFDVWPSLGPSLNRFCSSSGL